MRLKNIVLDTEKTLGNLKFTKATPKNKYGFPGEKEYITTLYSEKLGETFEIILDKELTFEPETPVELVGDIVLKESIVDIKQGDFERTEINHKLVVQDIRRKGAAPTSDKK